MTLRAGRTSLARSETIVICQTAAEGSQPLQGTFGGGIVTFDVESYVFSAGMAIFCSTSGCIGGSGRRIAYKLVSHWVGQLQNPSLIQGTWTGTLYVGLGKYPVEGAWTAIRAQ